MPAFNNAMHIAPDKKTSGMPLPKVDREQSIARRNDQLEHTLLAEWLDVADTGLVVLDNTSQVVMANQATFRLLDMDGAVCLNRPVRKLFRSVDDIAALIEWVANPSNEEGLHASRQTSVGVAHLLIKKRKVQHGSGDWFTMLCINDVTALVKSQNQMEAHHRQWQALNAAVVISDALQPDMPIVYVNPMFERMSGYAFGEVVGRNCRFLQGVETNQDALGPLREAIKKQTNAYAVLRNFRKDGSMFMNELFVSPVKDSKNQLMYYVGIQHMQDNRGNHDSGHGSTAIHTHASTAGS